MNRLTELRAAFAKLSPREMAVLRLMCAGLSNKKIAIALDCSVRTVEAVRSKLYETMRVESPAALGRLYGEWQTLEEIKSQTLTPKDPNDVR